MKVEVTGMGFAMRTKANATDIGDGLCFYEGDANGVHTRIVWHSGVDLFVEPIHTATTYGVRLVDAGGVPLPASLALKAHGWW